MILENLMQVVIAIVVQLPPPTPSVAPTPEPVLVGSRNVTGRPDGQVLIYSIPQGETR